MIQHGSVPVVGRRHARELVCITDDGLELLFVGGLVLREVVGHAPVRRTAVAIPRLAERTRRMVEANAMTPVGMQPTVDRIDECGERRAPSFSSHHRGRASITII